MGGRNLTNKLWNAAKFLQMALEGCSAAELDTLAAADFSAPAALAGLPLTERWVVSALHQVRRCRRNKATQGQLPAGAMLLDLAPRLPSPCTLSWRQQPTRERAHVRWIQGVMV